MAAALVNITAAGGAPLDGFRIMCRSAASPRAAEIARGQIEAHYHRALTSALPGARAAERAALLLAFVAGVQIMRQMIGLSALATCPPAVLTDLLAPVFQQLWVGQGRSTTPAAGGPRSSEVTRMLADQKRHTAFDALQGAIVTAAPQDAIVTAAPQEWSTSGRRDAARLNPAPKPMTRHMASYFCASPRRDSDLPFRRTRVHDPRRDGAGRRASRSG